MGWRPSTDPYAGCTCGSGRKYRYCCLKIDRERARQLAYGVETADEPAPIAETLGETSSIGWVAVTGGVARIPRGHGGESPAARAARLVARAWATPDGLERLALARRALALDPDCADAQFILAEESAAPEDEKLAGYRTAMDCAERALGPEYFAEHQGRFWTLPETRPYMRSRKAVADLLHAMGRTAAAAGHYRDLLLLNPEDNQNCRECLAACLLELGLWEELASLLRRYEEDAACWWDYGRAAVEYVRASGSASRAVEYLTEARETNPQVPAFLRGERRLPQGLAEVLRLGDATAAAVFATLFGRALASHPPLLEWLCAA